jgi:hypothetical protein
MNTKIFLNLGSIKTLTPKALLSLKIDVRHNFAGSHVEDH